jgi:xanthine dehydrogenase molybdopterin-binding subunit B
MALIQKLWDIAWDMRDNRNRLLHDTESSVAREVEIEQIPAQFLLGSGGLPTEAKPHFRQGLQRLLRQQPAYQTAWLLRIVAAPART